MLPRVLFDANDTQKYVLLEVTAAPAGPPILLLRGSASAEFHADVVEGATPAILAALPGARITVRGGGRLVHDAARSGVTVRLYGYSVAYGRAEHAAAARLMEGALPGASVSFSDEGY